jgi:divalent metal cation (Fe/Co/Zn/Cd) transporter
MRSGAPDSLRTVVVALVTNLATALAKLVAALFSGSSAMWAAAFHAFADSGNEVLLLIAQRRSGRPADEQHPLGHGRAAYFWALIASMAVFALGALLSVHQGIEGLLHQEPLLSFRIGLLLGFVAFQLAKRNGDILIGGQAAAALRRKIGIMIAAQPGIVAVTELVVTFIGPRQAWVVARVAIDESIDGSSVVKLVRATENFLRSKSPVIVRVDIVPRGRS